MSPRESRQGSRRHVIEELQDVENVNAEAAIEAARNIQVGHELAKEPGEEAA
jgi:hypothetical protein